MSRVLWPRKVRFILLAVAICGPGPALDWLAAIPPDAAAGQADPLGPAVGESPLPSGVSAAPQAAAPAAASDPFWYRILDLLIRIAALASAWLTTVPTTCPFEHKLPKEESAH